MWSDEGLFSGTHLSTRCYESHPVLKLGAGRLYGGNSDRPVVKDADVYVSLQSGSRSGHASDPWEPSTVVEVQYSIADMDIPPNTARFKKMVTWLCNQLHEGKVVHVGCMGGHGRTGLVLSAIVAEILDEKQAIAYVRKHYCKKAVESKSQIQFLMKHYGVAKAEPTKEEYTSRRASGPSSGALFPESWAMPRATHEAPAKPKVVAATTKEFKSMASSRSLWRQPTKPKGKK